MASPIAALIAAGAGTGAPTNPTSRYYGAATRSYALPDGTTVNYLARRILPQATIYQAIRTYVVVDGDRIDNLAARFLGDPLLAWILCDANGIVDPDELTAQVGRTIVIPAAAGVPAGARNG